MGQKILRDYQKKLFEYDYTIKKIDTILISGKAALNLREHYQLSREACQKLKSKCSQEMSDFARKNRLSLLLPPLSKEEKDELIRAIEDKRPGDADVNIKFDNLRPESEYSVPEIEEEEEKFSVYSTNKLSIPGESHYSNSEEEEEYLDDYDLEEDDVDNKKLYNSSVYNDDFEDEEIIEPDNNLKPEVAFFIKELKRGLSAFYGI